MLNYLLNLDRRWIFLLMTLAVLVPTLMKARFPETASPLAQAIFDRIEELPPGSKILLPFDYDPGSAPELQPMSNALVWHCAKKGHKLYFMALWPLGGQMIQDTVDTVLSKHYPDYKYGEDYVNLGFKPGNEGVIVVVVSNLKELYTTDFNGISLEKLPMTASLRNIRDMDLILNLSAGTPGAKEWVQYAATPYNIQIAAGVTGVQAPMLYPYIPRQLFGLLAAIKGAAEYEAAVIAKYPEYAEDEELQKGIQRMGPQLFAHCLIMLLIIAGNVIMFIKSQQQSGARA